MNQFKTEILFIVLLCVIPSLTNSCKPIMNEDIKNGSNDFYVGTYTNTESKGIYKYLLKENGHLEKVGLAVSTENPSFLCKSQDGNYLVAINEISNNDGVGTIESYLIKDDSLEFISRSTTGGAHPCYVSINENGFLLAANYSGGNIGLLKLNSRGILSEIIDVKQHHGSGITERQKKPHAHSVIYTHQKNNIIAADLGSNDLWFYKLDTVTQKIIPSEQSKLSLTPGAGPRHLAAHPNNKWYYIVNELNSTISQVSLNENEIYELKTSYNTLPKTFGGENYCADIHISSDGKFIYASNRGHNSIVIFKIDQINGSLDLIGHELTRGDWPRNFSLSPSDSFVLVANQNSNNIVSFKRDKQTGKLEYVSQIAAPSPVCILF